MLFLCEHALIQSIVHEEAEIVRMIFSDYLSGMKKNAIANKLHEMGVPTKGGGVWTACSIWCILKNEKYCGDLLLQKFYHEISQSGKCPTTVNYRSTMWKMHMKQSLIRRGISTSTRASKDET